MDDKQLRSEIIKLAHDNPDLRRHLLPLLKEGAGGGDNVDPGTQRVASAPIQSVEDGIKHGCHALAGGIHNALKRNRADVFAKLDLFMSTYGGSIEGQFVNEIDPSDNQGWFLLVVEWFPNDSKPRIRLVMRWGNRAREFSQEGNFDRNMTRAKFVQRYYSWVEKSLDDWLLEVTMAYNR